DQRRLAQTLKFYFKEALQGCNPFRLVIVGCDRKASENPLFSLAPSVRSGIFVPLLEGPRTGVGNGQFQAHCGLRRGGRRRVRGGPGACCRSLAQSSVLRRLARDLRI